MIKVKQFFMKPLCFFVSPETAGIEPSLSHG
jgi:hypothetical protein